MTANLREAKQLWEDKGWCVIEGVLPDEDIRAAQAVLPELFPTAEDFALDRDPERNRPFHIDSHSVMPNFPFESGSLNHLVLHERIIDLAQDFLGLTDIRLYQGMVSAKYAGGALDDEQLLHVDYGNHTLVVPRPEVGYQQFEMFIYLSDVTPGAATRMVSRHLTTDISTERTYLSLSEYSSLYEAEVPASGPAGAILCYRPDVYHRGVRIIEPGAARFMLHVSYKPVNADWLGSSGAWPGAAEGMAWHRFMQRANVRQLSMLGFPEPGHPYWNEATLRGVAARYPLLDMTPWRDAMPDIVPR